MSRSRKPVSAPSGEPFFIELIHSNRLRNHQTRALFSRVAPRYDAGRMARTLAPDNVVQWLLAGDPAIRWQTLRDLLEAPARVVERERKSISRTGWGARLLAEQGPDGRWAAGQSSDSGL